MEIVSLPKHLESGSLSRGHGDAGTEEDISGDLKGHNLITPANNHEKEKRAKKKGYRIGAPRVTP